MEWKQGKRLGKGGFGEVFIAHPKNPEIPTMAVKSASEEKAASLFAEHRVLARLRNARGIIHCFGGGLSTDNPDGKTTYNLFMEYAPGGSLTNLIASYAAGEGAGIPEGHVRVYTRMILLGLSAIHSHGFAHCDIKPDNILVFPPAAAGNRGGTKTGVCELKIADFGLALDTWKLVPGSRNKRGTARYMSPEVVSTGTITPAADIWALGCTVVEMLTGQQPWRDLKTKKEVKSEIGKGGSPEIPEWVSEQGKDFLTRCFATHPMYRGDVAWFLRHPFVTAGYRRGGGGVGAVAVGGGRVLGERDLRRDIEKKRKLSQRSPAVDFPLLPHEFLEQRRPAVMW